MKKWPKITLMIALLFIAGHIITGCGTAENDTPDNDPPVEDNMNENMNNELNENLDEDLNEEVNEEDEMIDEELEEENNEEFNEGVENNEDLNEAADDEEMIATGEEVVQQNCISCHGENLEGASGPDLIGVTEDFSDEELYDILVDGIGSMPGGLAQGEEEAVIEYLRTVH